MQGKLIPHRLSKKKTALSLLVIFLLTPVTLWLASVFGPRAYYVTAVLLIIYTMIPFFTAFESRKPQARELVVIAVMCAICIAARAAFIWLPHFKPMAALVIIAGIAFGAQAGFMTGSISMFVSNFIFGQGPWTPWQMFGFGLAGFLFGFLADRGLIPRARYSLRGLVVLAIGSGAFVLCVVGPLLDTSSLFTMMSVINAKTAMAVYLSGVPVNAVQAIGTVVTILLVANPILAKLERVRTKYGMLR